MINNKESIESRATSLRKVYLIFRFPLLFFIVLIGFFPGLLLGPQMDASVFTVNALALNDGRVMYLDIWDHKPPGLFWLLAPIQNALYFVPTWLTSWILAVTLTGLTVFTGHRLFSRLNSDSLWLRILLAAGLSFFLINEGSLKTEILALTFFAVSLSLWLRPAQANGFTSGLFFGLTCLSSIQSVSLIFLFLWDAYYMKSWRKLAQFLLVSTAVGTTSLLILAGNKALESMIDQLLTYNLAYAKATIDTIAGLPVLLLSFIALTIGFLAFAFLRLLKTSKSFYLNPPVKRALGFFLLGLALMGLQIILQKRYSSHYFILFFFVFVTCVAMLAPYTKLIYAKLNKWHKILAALPVIVIVMIQLMLQAQVLSLSLNYANGHPTSSVVQHIQQLTSANEDIFVWGNFPQLYVLSERLPSGPYSYLLPLTTPDYSSTEQVERLLSSWNQSPPRLIIDASYLGEQGQQTAPVLLEEHPVSQGDGRNSEEVLDPLRTFIKDNYKYHSRQDGVLFYRLNASTSE